MYGRIQFQPHQQNDYAENAVVANDANNRTNHEIENVVRITNICDCTQEEKRKVVKIDIEERNSGKGFREKLN